MTPAKKVSNSIVYLQKSAAGWFCHTPFLERSLLVDMVEVWFLGGWENWVCLAWRTQGQFLINSNKLPEAMKDKGSHPPLNSAQWQLTQINTYEILTKNNFFLKKGNTQTFFTPRVVKHWHRL